MMHNTPSYYLSHIHHGSCPCCNDALQKIKANVATISGLVSEKLPASIAEAFEPSLAKIRLEGKLMLAGLGEALREGRMPHPPDDFEAAVQVFNGDIDRQALSGGLRGPNEKTVHRLYALRFALAGLISSVKELLDEFGAEPSPRRN